MNLIKVLQKKDNRKTIPSKVYDRQYLLSERLEGFDAFQKGTLSFIKSQQVKMLELKKGMNILEVGVGRGELLLKCAQKKVQVTGIDYSAAAVKIAKKTLAGVSGARILKADCRKLPFGPDSFDRVFAGDVIEHMSFGDGVVMLQEMYRVLKPGGLLLLHTAPNTAFTKFTFPVAKKILRKIDPQSIAEIEDHVGFSKKVHLHEYNLYSLKKVARKAGLRKASVFIDPNLLRSGKHRLVSKLKKNLVINLIDFTGKLYPVRFFLGNDLYLKTYKTEKVRSLHKHDFGLLAVLFAALFVRFLGLNFNLPFIEFTDERTVGQNALYFAQTADFRHFHILYPPFHTYFQGVAIWLYSQLKGVAPENIFSGDIYLLLRGVVAAFGVASVFLVHKIGHKTSGNKAIGLVASIIFAFNLTHVAYSQLVKNEVPLVFFGLLVVYCSLVILESTKKGPRFWSGFWAGVATATAYTGIFFLVLPVVAELLASKSKLKLRALIKDHWKGLVTLALGSLVGFSLADPIFIFDNHLFRAKLELSGQLLDGLLSPLALPAWKWYLDYLWNYGLYPPVFLLAIAGIIFGLRKHFKSSLLLLSYVLVYGAVIFTNKIYYTDRLALPLIAVLVVFGAFGSYYLGQGLIRRFGNSLLVRFFLVSLSSAMVFVLFARVGWVSYLMSKPSSLKTVENWFKENTDSNTRIFLTANGGKLAFSPNKMETNHQFFYYFPEILNRPTDSLSLSYDYAILYWAGNSPAKWVEDLTGEYELIEDYAALKILSKYDFLRAIPTITNPFMVARSHFQPAAIYRLNTRPKNHYAIVLEVNASEEAVTGKALYVPGSQGSQTEVIYSTDFTLVTDSGSQSYHESFKNFEDAREINFTIYPGNNSFLLDRQPPTPGFEKVLKASLEDRLNLDSVPSLTLLGEDGSDFCKMGGNCRPSGRVDYHLTLNNLPKKVRRIVISDGKITWMGPFNGAYADALIKDSGDSLDVYFEPVEKIDSDNLGVTLYYQDKTLSLLKP